MCKGALGLNGNTRYQQVGAPGKLELLVVLEHLVTSELLVVKEQLVIPLVVQMELVTGMVTNNGTCPGWKPYNLES